MIQLLDHAFRLCSDLFFFLFWPTATCRVGGYIYTIVTWKLQWVKIIFDYFCSFTWNLLIKQAALSPFFLSELYFDINYVFQPNLELPGELPLFFVPCALIVYRTNSKENSQPWATAAVMQKPSSKVQGSTTSHLLDIREAVVCNYRSLPPKPRPCPKTFKVEVLRKKQRQDYWLMSRVSQ